MQSPHHVIPESPLVNLPTAPGGAGDLATVPQLPPNTTAPTVATGEGDLLGLIVMIVAVVVVALLGYWAISTAGRYNVVSLQPGRNGMPGPAPVHHYDYNGPRRLIREAFLRARTALEAKTGAPLKPLTLREIALTLRARRLLSVAPRYSRAMYSRWVPGLGEAQNIAESLEEVTKEWRSGDG